MSVDATQGVTVMPIEPGGPYASRLSRGAGYVPARIRGLLLEAGGMTELFAKVIWSAVRHPVGYWSDVIAEMAFVVQRSWLSITVALFGFLLALSIPAQQFVNLAGAGELYGPLLLVQSTRTFTVWVATLLVAGVIGAAMTAELGSRKVREELDAMQVMGIDPVRTLVLPRIVSITFVTTLLAIPAELITIFSSAFGAWYIAGIEPSDSFYFIFQTMTAVEVLALVLNCALAGVLVGVVCCYKGMSASGGAMGLGKAVNQAVVISFVLLFILQMVYNAIVLGFFPGMGAFR